MSKKALVIEDDGNIAELLHLYLEKEGFETAVALREFLDANFPLQKDE